MARRARSPLQLDDRRGEVVLRRPQPRALARGTVGARAEPPGGLVARPAAGGAVNALGHALALLEQARERRRVAVLARDRLDRGRRQRPQRQRVARPACSARGEHQQRAAGDGDALELGCDLRGRVVEVVDDEQRRAAAGARPCSITRRAASGEPAPEA